MIKCVFFDFDGTLIDSNNIKRKTFYDVTQNFEGADKILDKILSSADAGDRNDIFNFLTEELNLKKNIQIHAEDLINSYTKKCEHRISNAQEIKGAHKALIELKNKGLMLVISSATPQRTLNRIIELIGWSGLFYQVMGSPNSKLEHVKKVLFENNFSNEEVIYVGDSEIDRQTAFNSGCKFIGIGKDLSRFKSKPKIFLNNLDNLLKEIII